MGAAIAGASVKVTWAPSSGAAASATLAVTRPDGTAVDPAPVVSASAGGGFEALVPTSLPGAYRLAWSSGEARGADVLDVWPEVPRYLISVEDAVRAVVPTGKMTAEQREQIQLDLAAASVIIEDLTGPILPATQKARRNGGLSSYLLPHLSVSAVAVSVDGVALAADEVVADGSAGVVWLRSLPAAGFQNVEITYTVGGGAVPPNVRLACMEQVRFLWQTRRQGSGREAQTLGYTPSGYAIPYMVQGLVEASAQTAPGFA